MTTTLIHNIINERLKEMLELGRDYFMHEVMAHCVTLYTKALRKGEDSVIDSITALQYMARITQDDVVAIGCHLVEYILTNTEDAEELLKEAAEDIDVFESDFFKEEVAHLAWESMALEATVKAFTHHSPEDPEIQAAQIVLCASNRKLLANMIALPAFRIDDPALEAIGSKLGHRFGKQWWIAAFRPTNSALAR